MDQALDPLLAALQTPSPRPRLGYFCTTIPPELVHAAGFTPVRILEQAAPEDVALGDSYLLRNSCPFARACVANFVRGTYAGLAGLVAGHTCDTIRGVIDNAEYFDLCPPIVQHVDIPRGSDRAGQRAYYRRQLVRLVSSLERLAAAPFTGERLRQSLALYNRLRAALARIADAIAAGATSLPRSTLVRLIHLTLRHDPEHCVEPLERFSLALPPPRAGGPAPRRVVLLGSVVAADDYWLLELIEEQGGLIADDLVCSGSHAYTRAVDPGTTLDTALDDLTAAYLADNRCARTYPHAARVARLVAAMEQPDVAGVIYASLKFCDSHLYDVPRMRQAARERGLFFLHLEADLSVHDRGQLGTRLATFFEQTRRAGGGGRA